MKYLTIINEDVGINNTFFMPDKTDGKLYDSLDEFKSNEYVSIGEKNLINSLTSTESLKYTFQCFIQIYNTNLDKIIKESKGIESIDNLINNYDSINREDLFFFFLRIPNIRFGQSKTKLLWV